MQFKSSFKERELQDPDENGLKKYRRIMNMEKETERNSISKLKIDNSIKDDYATFLKLIIILFCDIYLQHLSKHFILSLTVLAQVKAPQIVFWVKNTPFQNDTRVSCGQSG